MKYDVYGIGSPLMDMMVTAEEQILIELKLDKGGMFLVDEDKLGNTLDLVKESIVKTTSGDSTANAIVGLANLGGKGAYLGKVGKDNHGETFISDLTSKGVDSKIVKSNHMTGTVIALITPDSERTMIVCLGACKELSPEDIIEQDIIDSKILHITGYQLEEPKLKETAIKAMEIAKKNNVKISLDLADFNLIKRNKEFLRSIVKDYANIVFANAEEAHAFTGKEPRDALEEISTMTDVAIVKVGKNGSMIKAQGKVYDIPCYNVEAVDTTGAGDMYAAGVLYGMCMNMNYEKAGKIGAFGASKVVEQIGARLDISLKEKIAEIIK
ncbi:MAG: adenosine kinase [Nanoarchaeota archaeon]